MKFQVVPKLFVIETNSLQMAQHFLKSSSNFSELGNNFIAAAKEKFSYDAMI